MAIATALHVSIFVRNEDSFSQILHLNKKVILVQSATRNEDIHI